MHVALFWKQDGHMFDSFLVSASTWSESLMYFTQTTSFVMTLNCNAKQQDVLPTPRPRKPTVYCTSTPMYDTDPLEARLGKHPATCMQATVPLRYCVTSSPCRFHKMMVIFCVTSTEHGYHEYSFHRRRLSVTKQSTQAMLYVLNESPRRLLVDFAIPHSAAVCLRA